MLNNKEGEKDEGWDKHGTRTEREEKKEKRNESKSSRGRMVNKRRIGNKWYCIGGQESTIRVGCC